MIDHAIHIAKRSPQRRFQTGCSIFKGNKLVSCGWSHESDRTLKSYFSVHSEIHALLRANRDDLRGATAYVATLSRKSGNLAANSKPCRGCAAALYAAGVVEVWFTAGSKVERLLLAPKSISELKLYTALGNLGVAA
jgi:deoxycytidylate deaminase